MRALVVMRRLAHLSAHRPVEAVEGIKMARTSNRQIVIAARPNGKAKLSDLNTIEQAIPSPGNGEVLLRNVLISMDPYQRSLMGNASTELPPIDIGQPMSGPTVAMVEQSRNASFAVGDHVVSWS